MLDQPHVRGTTIIRPLILTYLVLDGRQTLIHGKYGVVIVVCDLVAAQLLAVPALRNMGESTSDSEETLAQLSIQE